LEYLLNLYTDIWSSI